MHLFLMGRPHCGSTILDIMLGNSALIESVGELTSNAVRFEEGVCACGLEIAACPFWREVRETAAGDDDPGNWWASASRAIFDHAHVRRFAATWLAARERNRAPGDLLAVADASRRIGKAITAVSGKPHMLDSTKEATHALLLLKYVPEARAIHLVRDPRKSVASHYWRFKKQNGYFHYLRRKYHAPWMLVPFMTIAAGSWLVGNLLCEIDRWSHDGTRTRRVRYEDLLARPQEILNDLGRWLGVPLDEVAGRIGDGRPLAIGHNIGGNQIRLEGSVVFEARDDRIYDMPAWLDLLTRLVCWPLMLRYGYPLGSRAPARNVAARTA